MIWGQSAGASAVDYHNYAFWDDPIAHAFFAESGNVFGFPAAPPDADHTNFTFVARHLGCDFPNNASQELACMQKKDYNDIINFMGQYQDNSTLVNPKQPHIAFNPWEDEILVFSNYTERYLNGMVTKAPMIYSSVANEGGSLSAHFSANGTGSINQTQANMLTEGVICGAATASEMRHSIGLPTYRYREFFGSSKHDEILTWSYRVRRKLVQPRPSSVDGRRKHSHPYSPIPPPH
jgi:hypothetical protein